MKNKKIKVIFAACLFLVITFLTWQKCQNVGPITYDDKNGNGIWDDVEPFIKKTAVNKYHRLALEQFYKGFQDVLLDPSIGKKERDSKFISTFERGSSCLSKIHDVFKIPEDDTEEDAIVNDVARARAYIKYNGNLSGGMYPLWNDSRMGNPCDFEIAP